MTDSIKKVKLFLASSSELEQDRRDLEIYIKRKNDKIISQGEYLELIVWESFKDVMSQTRLQDEYNKTIKECDIFIMLFSTKVGKYSLEEFNIAHDSFKKYDKPKILTYFKDSTIELASIEEEEIESMFSFKSKLKDLGHYVTSYKTISDLKFHLEDQLQRQILPLSLSNESPGKKEVDPIKNNKGFKIGKSQILGMLAVLLIPLFFILNMNGFFNKEEKPNANIDNTSITENLKPTENISDQDQLYNNHLENGLLFIQMKEYNLGEIQFNKATELNSQRHEAENAIQWIEVLKLFDLLYDELPETEEGKFYARCVFPNQYETLKDSLGNHIQKLVKKGGPSDWKEMVCAGVGFHFISKLKPEMVLKIQKFLKSEELYFGPIDGQLSDFLLASIKIYDKENSCLSANPADCVLFPKDFIKSSTIKKMTGAATIE